MINTELAVFKRRGSKSHQVVNLRLRQWLWWTLALRPSFSPSNLQSQHQISHLSLGLQKTTFYFVLDGWDV